METCLHRTPPLECVIVVYNEGVMEWILILDDPTDFSCQITVRCSSLVRSRGELRERYRVNLPQDSGLLEAVAKNIISRTHEALPDEYKWRK